MKKNKNNMRLRVRLLGGLGNQLLIMLYSLYRSKKEGADLVLNIYSLDQYPTKYSYYLKGLVDSLTCRIVVIRRETSPLLVRLVGKDLRIAHLLTRAFSRDIVIRTRNILYIDSYMQEPRSYAALDIRIMQECINQIRRYIDNLSSLNESNKRSSVLLHLRLGDFATSENVKRDIIEWGVCTAMNQMYDIDVISNDFDYITKNIAGIGPESVKRLNIIETAAMSNWDLLHFMSQYDTIISNGSSLALMASILSSGHLITQNSKHQKLHRYLKDY